MSIFWEFWKKKKWSQISFPKSSLSSNLKISVKNSTIDIICDCNLQISLYIFSCFYQGSKLTYFFFSPAFLQQNMSATLFILLLLEKTWFQGILIMTFFLIHLYITVVPRYLELIFVLQESSRHCTTYLWHDSCVPTIYNVLFLMNYASDFILCLQVKSLHSWRPPQQDYGGYILFQYSEGESIVKFHY